MLVTGPGCEMLTSVPRELRVCQWRSERPFAGGADRRTMDFDEIKQILEMMREHDLAEFELERDNVKLRLRKNP